jgi:hypothetical protein
LCQFSTGRYDNGKVRVVVFVIVISGFLFYQVWHCGIHTHAGMRTPIAELLHKKERKKERKKGKKEERKRERKK